MCPQSPVIMYPLRSTCAVDVYAHPCKDRCQCLSEDEGRIWVPKGKSAIMNQFSETVMYHRISGGFAKGAKGHPRHNGSLKDTSCIGIHHACAKASTVAQNKMKHLRFSPSPFPPSISCTGMSALEVGFPCPEPTS